MLNRLLLKKMPFLLALLFLSSCASKNRELKHKNFISYDAPIIKQTKLNFDDIFTPIKKIKLKINKDDDLIGAIKEIKVHKNKILATDPIGKQIFCFDSEGNRLYSIKKNGSGPGEFLRLTDFDISSSGQLYLLDLGNGRVTLYDINSGKYIKEFNVRPSSQICCSIDGKGYYLFSGMSPHEKIIDYYDNKGNYVDSYCPPFFSFGAFSGNSFDKDQLGNLYMISPAVYKIVKFSTKENNYVVYGNRLSSYSFIKIKKNTLPNLNELDNSTALRAIVANADYTIVELTQSQTKSKWLDCYHSKNGKPIFNGLKVNKYLEVAYIDKLKKNIIYFIKHPNLDNDKFTLDNYEILIYEIQQI